MDEEEPKRKAAKISYDVHRDVLNVEEELQWMSGCNSEDFNVPLDTLQSTWRSLSTHKNTLSSLKCLNGESSQKFVDNDIYQQLQEAKAELTGIDEFLYQSARERSNAFEKIRKGGLFINRAAVKMANIDAILDFELTEPKGRSSNGEPLIGELEPLLFADICAGPGGFTEYILWRRGWNCKGFGFTLKEENDFKLEEFLVGTENFEPHYGTCGDGDIRKPENVMSFINLVNDSTQGRKVHFVTADGGICFTGKEDQQEVSTKELLLAQILVGISLVRPGGHFICKTFDLFTPFTVGLVYLLQKCFFKFCIHKPNTSRPANSERYLICRNKRKCTTNVELYLKDCHIKLSKKIFGQTPDLEIELVPLAVLKGDGKFFEYIWQSNERLASKQVFEIKKLLQFCNDNSLFDPRQVEFKQNCLEFWKLSSDRASRGGQPQFPRERIPELISSMGLPVVYARLNRKMNDPACELLKEQLVSINSPFDWRVIVIGVNEVSRKRGFFFSCGRGRNYFLRNCVWAVEQVQFELPKDTLVFGEIVEERRVRRDGRPTGRPRPNVAFHIIDALFLGGQCIGQYHFNKRHVLCTVFGKSMTKISRTDLVPIRVKKVIALEHLNDCVSTLTFHEEKDEEDDMDIAPDMAKGFLFLKITKDPWMTALDKPSQKKYWFNAETKQSTFEYSPGATADFLYMVENRLFWKYWCLNDKSANPEPSKVHLQEILEHVSGLSSKVVTG